jgi:uncharacterized protein (DUF1501 family)
MRNVSRRLVMKGMMGLLSAAVARPAFAAAGGSTRKMIFVFANGGWDPLTVFVPLFGSPHVDANDGGELATIGGLQIVDHEDRPKVRSFFQRWHSRAAIINGISVPSLSHEVCTRLMWTGQSVEGRPDWPSTVGAGEADAYTLPSLVISGPSFPDIYGAFSARAGASGQLADLIDGTILDTRDRSSGHEPLAEPLRSLVEDRVAERARAFAQVDPAGASMSTALRRARQLAGSDPLDFRSASFLEERIDLAIDALSRGISRVVTLEADGSWDTHTNNDADQGRQFQDLFRGLSYLMESLVDNELLADTTVVVLSEMGRTPLFNSDAGRDHWPYTSALLLGAGVRGDQVVSAFDERYLPVGYDPATGEQSPAGAPLTPEHLGATLLAISELDPAEHLAVPPIAAVIA